MFKNSGSVALKPIKCNKKMSKFVVIDSGLPAKIEPIPKYSCNEFNSFELAKRYLKSWMDDLDLDINLIELGKKYYYGSDGQDNWCEIVEIY